MHNLFGIDRTAKSGVEYIRLGISGRFAAWVAGILAFLVVAGSAAFVIILPKDSIDSQQSTILSAGSRRETLITRKPTTITSADSPYSILPEDAIIFADASGGNIVINLQSVGSSPFLGFFVKIDSSSNTVTLDGAGAETIDAELTVVFTREHEGLAIIHDGSEWLSMPSVRSLLTGGILTLPIELSSVPSTCSMGEVTFLSTGNLCACTATDTWEKLNGGGSC